MLPSRKKALGDSLAAASREAHLKHILEALNDWTENPQSVSLRERVSERMKKYRKTAEAGLFKPLPARQNFALWSPEEPVKERDH